MSIELRVEEYCQNCTEFEVDVEKIMAYDIFEEPCGCDTYIYCEHRSKCESIKNHLKKLGGVQKKENKDD